MTRFSPPAPFQANPEALRRAVKLLVEAESPLIIADFLGRNPGSVASLVEFAELLAIPVLDKGNRHNFPNTHPLDVSGGAGELLKKADVILALDVQDLYGAMTTVNRTTRVIEYVTNLSVKVIHISLNEMLAHSWSTDYQALQPTDVPICADTSLALPELTKLCREMMGSDGKKRAQVEVRLSETKGIHDRLRSKWMEDARVTTTQKDISTACLAYGLWEVIKKEDWVLVNGNSSGWARRLWDWTKPNQYLGRSGGAGLGYGMGASIGAALAHLGSGKICVDIQADGDLLMTSSALWTAAKHKIPLLIVMHNNQSFYNSEEHGVQIAKFRKRPMDTAGIGTHVDGPPVSFSKMAESYGVYGEGPIRRPEELIPALQRALKVVKEKQLPALVDVISESR